MLGNKQKRLPKFVRVDMVYALQIEGVEANSDGVIVIPRTPGFGPFPVSREYYAKFKPEPGDFYVVYQDNTLGCTKEPEFKSAYAPEAMFDYYQRFVLTWQFNASEILDKMDVVIYYHSGSNNLLDLQIATQLGYAIAMDKPLVIIHEKGTEPPKSLRAIAKEIVVIDGGLEKNHEIIAEVMAKHAKEITSAKG